MQPIKIKLTATFVILVIIGIELNLLGFPKLSRPTFKNAIEESGIKSISYSRGIIWADYNNDDDIDLIIFGFETKFYRNNGDGTFIDMTKDSGLKKLKSSKAGLVGNFDDDNCPDLFVNYLDSGINKQAFYKNNCNGTFTDSTQKANLKDSHYVLVGAAAADYNNDGLLDIYVADQGDVLHPPDYKAKPNTLYKNNGNGTFRDVTSEAGVMGFPKCPSTRLPREGGRLKLKPGQEFKLSFQPIWFDYNNDGKIDLFITNDNGISPLYKNNGNGTFRDATEEAGLCKVGTGMGVTVGDYNNNGYLDMYVTNVGQDYFWENNGDGTFSEVSQINGTEDKLSLGWGTGFLDYDNDGYLDLHVVNGIAGEEKMAEDMTDKLYKNNGREVFINVTENEGIMGDYPKESGALSDYNNDGFVDIVVIPEAETEPRFRLYQNQKNNNNWVSIKLIGTKSNIDAVGARIILKAGSLTQMREITMGSSFLGQNSLIQTFGLGKNNMIDSLDVIWPGGNRQTLKNPGIKKLIIIEESK